MKHLLLCLALLVFAGCGGIQNPYFYRAERGDQRISILGTIHVGVSARDLPSFVKDELAASNRAFFETDSTKDGWFEPKELTPEEKKKIWNKLAWIKKGDPSLETRLGPAYWAKLRARAPDVKPEDLRDLTPYGALSLIWKNEVAEVSPYYYRALNPYFSMDHNLTIWAKEQGKRIEVLDRDEHVCRYERGSGKLSDLKRALDGEGHQQEIDLLIEKIEAYKEGQFERFLGEFADEGSGWSECLLKKRNLQWAELIDKSLHQGDRAFAAVGLAHLITPEPRNLLDLLRDRGFRVRRVVP